MKLFCTAILAMLPVLAYGAPTPAEIDQGQREANRNLQRQQQQQEQERREQLLKRPQTNIEFELPENQTRPDDGVCRDIKGIEIEGAALLSESFRQKTTTPYINTCMGVGDIERLLGAITNYYIEKGYISARAYVQAQDLAAGTLRILVIEGIVEQILLKDGQKNTSIYLPTAFPNMVGKPLNLRDIEQGLNQVNRLQSNNATMKIEPGSKPGESTILIQNQPSRRLHATLTHDKFGGTATGQSQAGLSISLDSPLRLNDSLSITHRRSTDSRFDLLHSRSNSFFYSIPFGRFTVIATHTWSDYLTTIRPPGGALTATGTNVSSSLSTEYVAYRDKFNRIAITGSLTRKRAKNYLADQFLEVASRTLSTVDLNSAWTTRFLGGALGMNIGYNRGLSAFGALQDPANLPVFAPRAQFTKWTAGANWFKPFNISSQPFTFSTSLTAQAAEDVLYGSEQMSIGSIFNVRGYRNVSISGDNGYYIRNDLAMPIKLQVAKTPILFKPYVGYDFGSIHDRNDVEGGHLSGMALGASITAGRVSADITAVKPLNMPLRLKDQDEGLQLFTKLSVSF